MNEALQLVLNRFNIKSWKEFPIIIDGSRFKALPKLFRKLGFRKGAEIGVAKGFYSRILCGYNPKMKLYCVDPWKNYPEYIESKINMSQRRLNERMELAKERLKGANYEIIRKTSMEAVKDFEDNSLDFVFIDGNHSFQYVINDIAEWSKKVRPGGIISGHDYLNSYEESKVWIKKLNFEDRRLLCQVKDAVDAWTKTKNIFPWFVFIEEGGKNPTWFWVKEKGDKEYCLVDGYVDEFYKNINYYHPLKINPNAKNGFYAFYSAFPDFVDRVLSGKKFSNEELHKHPYYDYLFTKLPKRYRNTKRGHWYIINNKMRDAENLVHSLIKEGMRNPIDLFKYDKGIYVTRGARRLVIAKKLGWEKVKMRVWYHWETYLKNMKTINK